MKTENLNVTELTVNEQELVCGGAFSDFANGFCAVVGVAGVVSGGAAWANPVGGTAATACAIWGVYQLAQ